MKFTHTLTRFALSALAMGLLAAASWAANVPTPQEGDVFVGFRATSGTGSSYSYLVKLGQDTVFRNAASGSSVVLSLGDLGADLTATFGADWNTRSDLYWGVFGERNGVVPIVYGSNARTDVNVASSAWPVLNDQRRSAVLSAISSVVYYNFGYSGSVATANSPVGTIQTNSSNLSSYATQVGTAGTTDFSSLSQWSSIEGNFGSGVSGTALDLYRFPSASTVTRLGVFKISGAGVITFTVASSGYSGWASSKSLTSANNGASQDPDHDGISNLVEYVLGGNPLSSDASILPTQSQDSSNVYFSFHRSVDSKADTHQYVDWSTDLSTWTPVPVGSSSSGTVTVTANGSSPESISVAIPRSNSVNGRLFVRLRVTQP
jgi:hypothetical protein